MLNTLFFTVDNYILKKNQCIPRPVKIAIVYSLVVHDFIISYCKMLIISKYIQYIIANVLSVSEAFLTSILRRYSKALIINITHCNSTAWFEFLKLTD